MIDIVKSNFPLSGMGATGCTAYAMPFLIIGTSTQADGRAGFSFGLPSPASMVGVQIYTQWALFDAKANNAGFNTSNAARLKMGRQ